MGYRRVLPALLVVLAGCVEAPDPAAHCPGREPVECASDLGGHVPLRIEGSTVGRADGFGASRCGVGGGAAIEDAAFRWVAPRSARYRFSTEGSSINTILSVRRGSCGGPEIACNDDAREGVTHSAITLDLSECTMVTIVVDGADVDAVGSYVLSITSAEANCSDGRDDEGDGLTDCDDPDCDSPACQIENRMWPPAWAELERGVLQETNRVRAEGAVCGGEVMPPAPPLARDERLELAARLHSLDMAEQGYFSHESLDGRSPAARIAATGFPSTYVGENIARGYRTVAEVMAGWMSSPGHCRNIMNPRYRLLGVGYAEGADGTRWTQNFGGGP
jgi:uncharacterized protein YkwD